MITGPCACWPGVLPLSYISINEFAFAESLVFFRDLNVTGSELSEVKPAQNIKVGEYSA